MTGFGLWAVRRDVLQQSFTQVAAIRDKDGGPLAARRGEPLSSNVRSFATRIGSTAVVPVLGPLFSRMSFWFWSYDEIVRDVGLALDDDTIERIVLDVDSPGGVVAGCDDCVAALRAAGLQKPLLAHSSGLMASSAYWVSSAASEIAASPSATIGSIGALIRYIDIEGIFTKAGARVIEVVAEQSPNKALDPDSEEGQAELKALVDGAADFFIAGIADNRGETPEFIERRYGQGLVFKAGEARNRSMIDRLAGFDQFLADTADRKIDDNQGPNSVAAPKPKESEMNYKDLTLEGLREHRPDLVTEAENTARAAAERERDEAIARRNAAVAQAKAAAAPPVLQGEDAWRAEFKATAQLQSDFRSEDDYVLYKKMEAEGKVPPLTAAA